MNELYGIKNWMERRVNDQFSSQPGMQCEVSFLSDTIVVSMALAASSTHREAMSVLYLCDVISWILEHSLRSSIPFAYRGAVAIGQYEISEHFLIGPASAEGARRSGCSQVI